MVVISITDANLMALGRAYFLGWGVVRNWIGVPSQTNVNTLSFYVSLFVSIDRVYTLMVGFCKRIGKNRLSLYVVFVFV
jgi:hypothetical protein